METFSPECFQMDCSHHPGLSRGIEAGLELGGGFLSFTSHFGHLIFASINNISLQMFSTLFFPDKQLA